MCAATFDFGAFVALCVGTWGSCLMAGAAAVIFAKVDYRSSPRRVGVLTALLLVPEIFYIVATSLEPPVMLGLTGWLWLIAMGAFGAAAVQVLRRRGGAVVGRPDSTMPALESIGAVRHTFRGSALVGLDNGAALFNGWTPVDVSIGDGGIAVMETGSILRRLLGGFWAFPDVTLRWADIEDVKLIPPFRLPIRRLRFSFAADRGFTLVARPLRGTGFDLLVDALESHGVVVAHKPAAGNPPSKSRASSPLA